MVVILNFCAESPTMHNTNIQGGRQTPLYALELIVWLKDVNLVTCLGRWRKAAYTLGNVKCPPL